jgi:hypothetical protein
MEEKWSFKPLTASGERYGIWTVDAADYLLTRNPPLWNSLLKLPTGKDPETHVALAYIRRMCDDSVKLLLVDCKDAVEAWTVLKGIMKPKSTATLAKLTKDIANVEKADNDSLVEYIGRVKQLHSNVLGAGGQMTENEFVIHLLNGLPEAYGPMVLTLTTIGTGLELAKVQPKLLEFESKLGLGSQKEETVGKAYLASRFKGQAPKVGGLGQQKKACFICDSTEHLMRECPHKVVKKNQAKTAFVAF